VAPGQVVGEVLEIVQQRRANDDVATFEFEYDHGED
jgi:hypothetical protein